MVRKHFRSDMPPLSIPSVTHAPIVEEIVEPPPVQKQAAISKPSSCCSIRVDFKHNDPCYVFRTTHSATSNLVAASVSDNSVKIYSLKGNQLVHQAGLLGHTGTITDINFCSSDTTPAVLMSSSKDGSVRGWDARSGHQVEGYNSNKEELFSFSVLGHMVVAGGPGSVLLWDRRVNKALARMEDTHMDDVTQVKLHSSGRLISASTDGLVAVHDISKSLDDDDAFQAALNINTSPEEVGFWGQGEERLWLRTGTESLHLWEWMAATQDHSDSGGLPLAEFPDARAQAATAAAASTAAASFPQVDYLIGCHYDLVSQQLMMMAGTIEGDVGFFPISLQPPPSGNGSSSFPEPAAASLLAPVVVLHGGHDSIVRSVQCMPGAPGGLFGVSGGEDSRVCLWSVNEAGSSGSQQQHQAAAGPHRGNSSGQDADMRESKASKRKGPY